MNSIVMTIEHERLKTANWKKWGPYVSDRQWGTVREYFSADGDAWNYVTHDMARSKAYRWGEEGIAGLCDDEQLLCFALSLWNKKDPILKERYFGLTNTEGKRQGPGCFTSNRLDGLDCNLFYKLAVEKFFAFQNRHHYRSARIYQQ